MYKLKQKSYFVMWTVTIFALLACSSANNTTPTPTATQVILATSTILATQVPPTNTPVPTPFGGGGYIAFASDRDGIGEIYVMNIDGTNQQRLTSRLGKDFEPTWSPDGRFIAFCSQYNNTLEIYVMNANGTDQRLLSNGCGPAWSPDGSLIAFHSYHNGNVDIYTINADGTNLINVTNHLRTDSYPAWSPDGKFIAFHSTRDGKDDSYNSNWEIYVMNSDGTGQRRLTDSPGLDWLPSWSPDQQTIAFWSNRSGTWEIYLMDTDGKNQRKFTESSGARDWVSRPAWSSDGRHIAFVAKDVNGDLVIRIIDVVTGNYQLESTSVPGYDPTWSWPNSSR